MNVRTTALLAATTAVVLTGPARAQQDPGEALHHYGDLVSVFSGDLHVPAGVERHGSVVSIGGNVVIEGTVDEVIVVLGSVTVHGRVRGQLVGVMSKCKLEDAEIGGQVVNILGSFKDLGSRIGGQTVNFSFGSGVPGLWWLLFWIRMAVLVAAFVTVLLLVALVPERIRLIGEAAPRRYVSAFFVGLLGYLGMLVVFLLLTATVVGIPVALFAFHVLRWLGIAGLFYAIGQRIGQAFGGRFSLLGAVAATFAIWAAVQVSCAFLGIAGVLVWLTSSLLFKLMIEIPGIGLLILTRIGTQANGMPLVAIAPAAPPIVDGSGGRAAPAEPPAGSPF